MHTQVARRKSEIRQEIIDNGSSDSSRSDVFSRLVLANESEAEKLPLDDQELVGKQIIKTSVASSNDIPKIGNVFVILFAGHGKLNENTL